MSGSPWLLAGVIVLAIFASYLCDRFILTDIEDGDEDSDHRYTEWD